MSHPQEPQRQPSPSETERYVRTLHNTALVTAIACPLIALLPPRKLDLLTMGLAGTSVYSTNYLIRESSGRSILQHLSGYKPPMMAKGNADEADPHLRASDAMRQERQEALRAAKEPMAIAEQAAAGKQKKDWVRERDEEVQDALDVGKGLSDMIVDQIYEVWNWGKKRDDDE